MKCNGVTRKNKPCGNKVKRQGEYCRFHKPVISSAEVEVRSESEKKFEEKDCCVCLESFEKGFVPLNPCGHYIHEECVYKTGTDLCPLCRDKVVFSKDAMNEFEKYKRRREEDLEERNMQAAVEINRNIQAEVNIYGYMQVVEINMYTQEVSYSIVSSRLVHLLNSGRRRRALYIRENHPIYDINALSSMLRLPIVERFLYKVRRIYSHFIDSIFWEQDIVAYSGSSRADYLGLESFLNSELTREIRSLFSGTGVIGLFQEQ